MFPPTLLPSHHKIPQTQLPKLVVVILASLKPTTDAHQRRIGTALVVPPILLPSLIISVDEQPIVSSLTLLVSQMMVIAFATKGLGRDQFGIIEAEEPWNLSWESISTTIKRE